MDPMLAMQAALQAGGDDAPPAIADAAPAVGDAVPAVGVGGVVAPALGGVVAPAVGVGGVVPAVGVVAPALGGVVAPALGGVVAPALGGVVPDPPRIVLRRGPADLAVDLIPRVLPQWALPRNAGPNTPPNDNWISRDDCINRFAVNVEYVNLEFCPPAVKRIPVTGGYTIEQFCGKVLGSLQETSLWDDGMDLSAKFSATDEDGKSIYIPKGTKLAEIVRRYPNNDGSGLDLKCTIVDNAPFHLYAIRPAPLE